MEETKELQTAYKIFRAVIYVSLLMEFFEYAIDPAILIGEALSVMFMTVSKGGLYTMTATLFGAR